MRQSRSRNRIIGTTERPRMCVFVSNKQIYVQIVNDLEGRTLAEASTLSAELQDKATGKSMTEKAGLVGGRIAEVAKEKGVSAVCFDKSGYKYGKRLSSLADAARKGGLQF